MDTERGAFVVRCTECDSVLSDAGYRSTLLSDHYVNVYSTNSFSSAIVCVYEPYTSKKCRCMIKDIACVDCGLVVGYHVEQPCKKCLGEENNGHMWMFCEEKIKVCGMSRQEKIRSPCLVGPGRKNTVHSAVEPER